MAKRDDDDVDDAPGDGHGEKGHFSEGKPRQPDDTRKGGLLSIDPWEVGYTGGGRFATREPQDMPEARDTHAEPEATAALQRHIAGTVSYGPTSRKKKATCK